MCLQYISRCGSSVRAEPEYLERCTSRVRWFLEPMLSHMCGNPSVKTFRVVYLPWAENVAFFKLLNKCYIKNSIFHFSALQENAVAENTFYDTTILYCTLKLLSIFFTHWTYFWQRFYIKRFLFHMLSLSRIVTFY